MATKQYTAPTGAAIVGTLERIYGTALISGIDPDTAVPEYSGETKVEWDSQTTVTDNVKCRLGHPRNIVYVDENGDEWLFRDLTPIDDTEKNGGENT